MQKGRQREQPAINGGQTAPKRNVSVGGSAAVNVTGTKKEVEQTISSATEALPSEKIAIPAHGNGNGTTSLPNLPVSVPHITEPLIGDDLSSDVSFPGIAGLPHVSRVEQTPEEVARSSHARRRLWQWVGLFLLSAILIGESLLLSPWTDPVAAQPPRQVASIPLVEVNQFGVNVFLQKEVDRWKRDNTLQMAQDMGATWIKQQFPWAEIEFAQNSYWDPQNKQSSWVKYDNIVDLAEQHGQRIIARIDSTPDWARADDTMPQNVQEDLRGHKGPPSSGHLADFSEFIKTFVSRYKGRVAAIQVWNEPNLRDEWYPAVNAKDYVTLLSAVYAAAKSVDPDMIILAAPLATNMVTKESMDKYGALNELDYLQAMYYAGAKPYFDAMSANAYGLQYAPEDPPSNQALNFRRVELVRKVMEDNGDSAKSVWFNEYGWNASPTNCCTTLPWGRVTPEQQADYTVRGIEYARQHWPWAGVFTVWYLRQVGDIPPTKSEYYFGLVNTEFVPNSAYWAVKKIARDQLQVATPGQWGSLSPVVSAGPRWEVHLSSDVPGGAYVAPSAAAVDTGDSVRVLFQGTDVKLTLVPLSNTASLTPTDVIAARYYVTVDGASNDVASGLQRDDKGRAYIDLPAGAQATEVKVVRGLDAEFRTGQHELRITAGPLQKSSERSEQGMATHLAAPLPEDRSVELPGIGALTVEARRSYVFFMLISFVLVAGIAFEIAALWRNRSAVETAPVRTVIAEGQGADGR